MRILAIDTATEACSAALWNDGNCLTSFKEYSREHTKCILPLVKKILRQGNIALTDLNALAFSRGPGSFTGVRLSINIAQGLALGASLPMIGISTMATMAQGAFRKTSATRVLVAIDARMGEVYWAEYTRDKQGVWHGEETEAIYKLEMVNTKLKTLSGEWSLVGTGWKIWPKINLSRDLTLSDGNTLLPTAEDMIPIACQLLATGKTVTAEHAEPVYLRNEVARKNLSVLIKQQI